MESTMANPWSLLSSTLQLANWRLASEVPQTVGQRIGPQKKNRETIAAAPRRSLRARWQRRSFQLAR